jgi:hypothetical protein
MLASGCGIQNVYHNQTTLVTSYKLPRKIPFAKKQKLPQEYTWVCLAMNKKLVPTSKPKGREFAKV